MQIKQVNSNNFIKSEDIKSVKIQESKHYLLTQDLTEEISKCSDILEGLKCQNLYWICVQDDYDYEKNKKWYKKDRKLINEMYLELQGNADSINEINYTINFYIDVLEKLNNFQVKIKNTFNPVKIYKNPNISPCFTPVEENSCTLEFFDRHYSIFYSVDADYETVYKYTVKIIDKKENRYYDLDRIFTEYSEALGFVMSNFDVELLEY